MTTQKQQDSCPRKELRDQDLIGADATILRAAKLACLKAIETTGSVPIFRDGKIVREEDTKKIFLENSESRSSYDRGLRIQESLYVSALPGLNALGVSLIP